MELETGGHICNAYKEYLSRHKLNIKLLNAGDWFNNDFYEYYFKFVKNNLKFCLWLDLLYFNRLVPLYNNGTHIGYIIKEYKKK